MAIPVPVQSVGAAATANVSSISATLTPTNGNNLIAKVVARCGTTGVSGPAGWQKAIAVLNSSFETSIWYLEYYQGDGQSQTYTWTMLASDSMEVSIQEVNGLASSGSLDQVASNTSNGVASNPVDSGTTTLTTQATEYLVAAMGSAASGNRTISGLTSGWTQGLTENSSGASHPTHLTDCYQVVTASTTANCEFTLSTAQLWNACVATFRAAGAVTAQVTLSGGGELSASPVALASANLAGGGGLAATLVAIAAANLSGGGGLAAMATNADVVTFLEPITLRASGGPVTLRASGGPVTLTGGVTFPSSD